MESLIIKVGAISILISLIFQERKCERKLSDTLSKAYLVRTISLADKITGFASVSIILFSLEPTWDDLKRLKRSHIEPYIQWLHEYSKNKITQKRTP